MIEIQISSKAFNDLNTGFFFYDNQELGLGDYFLSCLKSDIESLKHSAGIHRQVYRDYHRLLSQKFPFAIYYSVTHQTVKIWAIVDCRRNPEWIRNHLEK